VKPLLFISWELIFQIPTDTPDSANADSYEASNKEAYLHHQGVISFEKKMVKQIVEQHYQQ
jgi:hypothetical protein